MQNPACTSENKNVKIKICGIFRDDDLVAVNETLPDYIGFVFAKSSRMIDFETAKKFKEKLNEKIKAVGVFVDEKIETIVKLYKAKIIDIAQLHGNEDKEYIKNLQKHCNIEIIKALKAGNSMVSQTSADFILFDTPDKKLAGGTGKTFDWSLVPKINKPVFLAGGLNSANIIKAINMVRPYAVDISSGVETNGHKDFEKISEIIKIVRGHKYE